MVHVPLVVGEELLGGKQKRCFGTKNGDKKTQKSQNTLNHRYSLIGGMQTYFIRSVV